MPAVALLGPFLALSIFAEEDPSGAEHYFSGPNKQNARTVTSQVQQDLEFSRISLHKLFHAILVNASSRNSALNFLSECMARNLKRQQMQVIIVTLYTTVAEAIIMSQKAALCLCLNNIYLHYR